MQPKSEVPLKENKMNVIGSVQARLGSTRLPGKVLMHLGEERIADRVMKRVQDAETIDETWLTTGDRPENEAILELCERKEYQYSRGPEEDLLKRHLNVSEESGCDVLVRVTGDCPFVPSEEIDRVVERHEENDARYTTNHAESMPIGTAVDAIDADVLQELWEMGED